MLWLSVSVSCIIGSTQKGANLGLKCVRMRLAARLHPEQTDRHTTTAYIALA